MLNLLNLFNKYLFSISAAMIMSLSVICLAMPHIKLGRDIFKKSKMVKYVPGISQNVWKPILFFLIISIFIYSIFLLHELFSSSSSVSPILSLFVMIIVCVCLIYTMFGFMLMFDYIERAYNVWNFRSIMILLFLLASIHYVPPNQKLQNYKKYFLGLYAAICIILAIMMSLMINEFRYYIKN